MPWHLIDTTEMYLWASILELGGRGDAPAASHRDRLGYSGADAVSQTVARMERDGLLHDGDRRLASAEEGRSRATGGCAPPG